MFLSYFTDSTIDSNQVIPNINRSWGMLVLSCQWITIWYWLLLWHVNP